MSKEPVDYTQIWSPIEQAALKVAAALSAPTKEADTLRAIVRAMIETQSSIRAVLSGADKSEETGSKTGRWVDATYLARPSLEACMIGLLILTEGESAAIEYQQHGLDDQIREHVYDNSFRHPGDLNPDRASEYLSNLGDIASTLGLPDGYVRHRAEEHRKALANMRMLPTGFAARDLRARCASGQFGSICALIHGAWTLACDDSHVGSRGIAMRTVLRGDPVNLRGPATREELISGFVHDRSVFVSMVALLAVLTAIVQKHFADDDELKLAVAKAWDLPKVGIAFAHAIWCQWAKAALGVVAEDCN